MRPSQRFFQLLHAYEELTRLETFALSEDNLLYLNRLQKKKGKLADRLAPMRRQAGLSSEESRRADTRLRSLQATERRNLNLLQVAMKSVTESLAGLNTTGIRCSRLRTTYRTQTPEPSGSLAGRA